VPDVAPIELADRPTRVCLCRQRLPQTRTMGARRRTAAAGQSYAVAAAESCGSMLSKSNAAVPAWSGELCSCPGADRDFSSLPAGYHAEKLPI
jgi:hypothetical protein